MKCPECKTGVLLYYEEGDEWKEGFAIMKDGTVDFDTGPEQQGSNERGPDEQNSGIEDVYIECRNCHARWDVSLDEDEKVIFGPKKIILHLKEEWGGEIIEKTY